MSSSPRHRRLGACPTRRLGPGLTGWPSPLDVSRRHFLASCRVGLGSLALGSLLTRSLVATPSGATSLVPGALDGGIGLSRQGLPGLPGLPHHAPRARSVIYLFMAGGPSQLDLFDPKPLLAKHDGEEVPQDLVKDKRYAFIRKDAKLMASQFSFARHGPAGAELSELLPHLARVTGDIALVRSVVTDAFNHAPAQVLMNTGATLPGRPCMGSWMSYGLGSEADDLPGFVVLNSAGGTSGGGANWSSGFLPTQHQGVPFRSQGDPILNVSSPAGVDRATQREALDLIGDLNRRRLAVIEDPEIATRIAAYEMAYRMQMSAPELMDLRRESPRTLESYGAEPGKASFASNCLLARRLVERGVRFVQLYHEAWDHHSDVAGGLKAQCGLTDRPAAALIEDLKQRNLLDSTLVIWGGEFGRTPMVESNAALGRSRGRDHHPQAFTMWLAGGGIRPGITLGKTDDLGFHVAEDPVHVHDLHATILHLLGLDHLRLTYRFKGRDFRLTDVAGELVEKLMA